MTDLQVAASPGDRFMERISGPSLRLFGIGFLIYLLLAPLLSTWKVPAAVMLSAYGGALLVLVSFAIRLPIVRAVPHWPTVAMALLMSAIILVAGFYGSRYGAWLSHETALNATVYFVLVILASSPLLLLARSFAHERPAAYVADALFIGLALFCLIQAILIIARVNNPMAASLPQIDREAVFARYFGFGAIRIMLPLSSAFQAGGAIPLVTGVMAVSRLARGRVALNLCVLMLATILLLLLDAQQFILALMLAMVFNWRVIPPTVMGLAAALVPWIYILIIAFVMSLFPGLSDLANSRGANQFGLFTGRQYIWDAFWAYFEHASVSQILLGNGLVGQATAGISYGYSIMFGLWPPETRIQMPLHNSYLQTIADMGLIGLFALMTLLYTATYRAAKLGQMKRPDARAWRGISLGLVALSTVAASEVALTVYMKESAAVFVVLVGTVAWFGGRTGGGVQRRLCDNSD